MKPSLAIFAAILAAASCLAAAQPFRVAESRAFPDSDSQRAEVAVSGNVSRLVPPLDIAKVRKPSPEALSCGDFVKATPGFSWFCSRHWAVKTDMPEESAACVLELLELAWPQQLALFGAEPLAGRRRLALVVASDRTALKRAMVSDSMFSFSLGGVTQEGYGCSYLYAGTPYQTRYIVLHEATHLFQYALTGNTRGVFGFFTEGVADYLSSHVYDPEMHTLAVDVLDRAPIHNHLADGLAEWRESGEPPFAKLFSAPSPSRGLSVLLTAFLQSTPEYAGKWREFCRRLVLQDGLDGKTGKEASDLLLSQIYGSAAALDTPFAAWMHSLSPSYSLARREFDQEGGTFVSCVPASAEAPAVLEGKTATDGHPAEIDFGVKWCGQPDKGSFARIELLSADGGETVSVCTLSASRTGSLGIFEVDGTRIHAAGARRLHSLLMSGTETRIAAAGATGAVIELMADGETMARIDAPPAAEALLRGDGPLRWRISASQPGIAFTPFIGGKPVFVFHGGEPAPPERAPLAASPAPYLDAAIGDWQILGPFALPDSRFGHCRKPVDPAAIDTASVHTLDDGTFVQWQAAALNANPNFSRAPIANLTATFGRQANNSFALAIGHVECDTDRNGILSLGVSDGVEIFVNGVQALDDVRRREWQDGHIRIPVRLHAGVNTILARITHGDGVWLLSGGLVFTE